MPRRISETFSYQTPCTSKNIQNIRNNIPKDYERHNLDQIVWLVARNEDNSPIVIAYEINKLGTAYKQLNNDKLFRLPVESIKKRKENPPTLSDAIADASKTISMNFFYEYGETPISITNSANIQSVFIKQIKKEDNFATIPQIKDYESLITNTLQDNTDYYTILAKQSLEIEEFSYPRSE